jgi:hypothetical protein
MQISPFGCKFHPLDAKFTPRIQSSPLGPKLPLGYKFHPLYTNFNPTGYKVHPWWPKSPQGANFIPDGKLVFLKTGLRF